MKSFMIAISRSLTEDENKVVFDWLDNQDVQFIKFFETFWVIQSQGSAELLHSHFIQLLPSGVKAVICDVGEYPEFIGMEQRNVGWVWNRT